MNINDQETDWNYTSGSSAGLSAQLSQNIKWQTSGSLPKLGDIEYSTSINKPDITKQAKKILTTISNDEVRTNATKFLLLLQTTLERFFDISELPPLRAFQSENQSLIFEWVFPHFRVGFSIEPNVSESGWFLVSDDTAGSIMASGRILGKSGTESIVFWLLQFIKLNY